MDLVEEDFTSTWHLKNICQIELTHLECLGFEGIHQTYFRVRSTLF